MPVPGAAAATRSSLRSSTNSTRRRRSSSMTSSVRSSVSRRDSLRSSVSRRDSMRSSMGCGSLIAAMEGRLHVEDESNSSSMNDSSRTTSQMSLGQSSRNMFLNIAILTSDAPIPVTELRDMGAFPIKKDAKQKRRRRRFLGMKPPKGAECGDGLFRV